MKTFSIETQKAIFEAQHGICKVLNCYEPIVDFYHRVRNTKTNQKLYPLLINSVFNCTGLCRVCHINNSHLFNITNYEAEIYEDFLRGLK